MDDLVYVQVYCTDLLLRQFNAAYRTLFSKDFPARAFIGAGSLLRGGHSKCRPSPSATRSALQNCRRWV